MTKRWNELDEYFALHRIWLPKALESAMAEPTDMYREHARKWESALDEWARPQPMDSDLENAEALNESLNQGHKLYEGQVRETRDWFEGERHRLEGVMWSAARKVLAVDEQEDEGGGGNGSSHHRATIGPNAADMGLRTSQNSIYMRSSRRLPPDYRKITDNLR